MASDSDRTEQFASDTDQDSDKTDLDRDADPGSYSGKQLFELFDYLVEKRSQKSVISFQLEGRKLATFTLSPGIHQNAKFTCVGRRDTGTRSEANTCMEIAIFEDEIHLVDYFYAYERNKRVRKTTGTTYRCAMKPTSIPQHKLFLNTLLDFLAYALEKPRITLDDASFKKHTKCPPISHTVFLVAGKQSFYENVAGFRNTAIDDRTRLAGARPLPSSVRVLAQTVGIDATTYETLAAEIIHMCKQSNLTPEGQSTMKRLVSIIETHVYEGSDLWKVHRTEFEYSKSAGNKFRAVITTSSDPKGTYLPLEWSPGEATQKFMVVDIYPNQGATRAGARPPRRQTRRVQKLRKDDSI